MSKLIWSLIGVWVIMTGCGRYAVYQFDNGDDYFCEGVQRIVGDDGKIGFADSTGRVVIAPRFAFAFPFKDSLAQVTDKGWSESDGEHSWWKSPEWYHVDHNGMRVNPYTDLERSISEYVDTLDADLGVAVIFDGGDTVEVNGSIPLPMLSVYKFPQALAVANYCVDHGVKLTDTVTIADGEMKMDTWSPMRDKHGLKPQGITVDDLLRYSLQSSDNNACDILFRVIGGTETADRYIDSLGFSGIDIVSTEDEMHQNLSLCYNNSSSAMDMAALLDRFSFSMRYESAELGRIAELMETCETGKDRLAAPLEGTRAHLGHKTGTGDTDSEGRLIAVNDVGYVDLPGGRRYVIAVFVSRSGYGMAETSAIVAHISSLVYDYIKKDY